jgi:transposase
MAKFTKEEKINIVLRYINGNNSMNKVAKEENISHSELSAWVLLYEHHGIEGFIKRYTSYSLQFKMDVLNYMDEQGISYRKTAAIFNLSSYSMIRSWRLQLNPDGLKAHQSKTKELPSMKKETKKVTQTEDSVKVLEARIKQLEMENAYLKKLNALVQEQEKLQTKLKRK